MILWVCMSETLNVLDLPDRFAEYLKSQKRASATILAYVNDIKQLADFLSSKGVKTVNSITPQLLEEFKSYLEKNSYTPKSISRKINSIKTLFRFLKNENLVESDPAASVSHPKYTIKPPRILSKLEYRALRDACRNDVRISAIVELMLQTGIRIGEVANLKMEDYRGNEIYIRPYESHEGRTIPLNKAAKEALARYLSERPKVKEQTIFITKTGRPFLVRNIRSAIERYFQLAGIKNAKVNDLRHTWVYHHLAAGTPLTTIAKLAGHKRLSTTERYLDLLEEKPETPTKLQEL